MGAFKFRKGFVFASYRAAEQSIFEMLFDIFKELILHTSGDFEEAIDWLRELDKEYELTTPDYTIDDFIEDLIKKGYIQERINPDGKGKASMTSKMEQALRQRALNQVFGKMQKGTMGNHQTRYSGNSDEKTCAFRKYRFGDPPEHISMTDSLKNAQINHGLGDFFLAEEDLVVEDSQLKTQMSTVLMIDISHSMILYGEDRITPAKKVAMALSELIITRYPKDSLDIIVFGNDAWAVKLKDLPYLQVGPFHTNTVAGLQLAMGILQKKRNANKQIFMITDGKPSCLRLPDGTYYKNPVGLDPFIVGQCYKMASQARRLNIPITTFLVATDPYLQQFIARFSDFNRGKAYYTGLGGLGQMIFEDYETNRRKTMK